MNEARLLELMFTQDGSDLVISTVARANNSPHVLWTRVHSLRGKVVPEGGRVEDAKQEYRISLHYYLFQNRDLYTRSRKDVEITWRLPSHTRGSETYIAVELFDPNSAELNELLPKLEALAVDCDSR